MLLQTIIV